MLYLLIKHANNTRSIFKFDSGTNKELSWTSREFIMNSKSVLSAGRVDADANVVMTLTGDNYSFEKTTLNDNGFRLPPGKPKRMKISIRCTGRVNTLTLASSMGELL